MNTIVEDMKRKGVSAPYHFTGEEFLEEIRKAEKGPFISIDELERRIETLRVFHSASSNLKIRTVRKVKI